MKEQPGSNEGFGLSNPEISSRGTTETIKEKAVQREGPLLRVAAGVALATILGAAPAVQAQAASGEAGSGDPGDPGVESTDCTPVEDPGNDPTEPDPFIDSAPTSNPPSDTPPGDVPGDGGYGYCG